MLRIPSQAKTEYLACEDTWKERLQECQDPGLPRMSFLPNTARSCPRLSSALASAQSLRTSDTTNTHMQTDSNLLRAAKPSDQAQGKSRCSKPPFMSPPSPAPKAHIALYKCRDPELQSVITKPARSLDTADRSPTFCTAGPSDTICLSISPGLTISSQQGVVQQARTLWYMICVYIYICIYM